MARRPTRSGALLAVVALCLLGGLTMPAAGGPGMVSTTDGSAADSAALLAQDSPGRISSITVEQPQIRAGETVTVTAVVENTGTDRQQINTTLTIGDEQRATEQPSVDPEYPVVVSFEVTVDSPGNYTVAVNGVEAEQTLVVQGSGDGSDGTDDSSDDQSGSDDGSTDQPPTLSVDSENVTVESVELSQSSVDPGQTVEVTALLANTAPEIANVSVALEIDGEVVETGVAENVLSQENNPGLTIPYSFEYTPEESGTYTVSVNGTEAGSELEVSGGGGGLFGFLSFLPIGLLRPLLLFVVLPVAVVYGILKALAIYLGY